MASLFLTELKDRLVAQGVGVYNTNIFIGGKVVVPPRGAADATNGNGPYLFLRNTGGAGSDKTQNNTGTFLDSAQLTATGLNYDEVEAMAFAAYNALGGKDGLFNILLGETWYVRLVARQQPTDMTMDGAARAQNVFNVEAERTGEQVVFPSWIQQGWFQ